MAVERTIMKQLIGQTLMIAREKQLLTVARDILEDFRAVFFYGILTEEMNLIDDKKNELPKVSSKRES